jgi:hypothetical protein
VATYSVLSDFDAIDAAMHQRSLKAISRMGTELR